MVIYYRESPRKTNTDVYVVPGADATVPVVTVQPAPPPCEGERGR